MCQPVIPILLSSSCLPRFSLTYLLHANVPPSACDKRCCHEGDKTVMWPVARLLLTLVFSMLVFIACFLVEHSKTVYNGVEHSNSDG